MKQKPNLACLLATVILLYSSPVDPVLGQKRLDELIKKQQDQNSDGKISKEEATGRLKKNFKSVDLNQDGVIDGSELKALAERRSRNPGQRNQNKNRFTVPEGVEFKPNIAYREGNKAWTLDLALPKETKNSPRPAIVFVHGGGWRGGDKSGGIWRSYPVRFAQKGYVCISINYRLSQEAPFPACVEDCKCAVRWLRANAKRYNVDPNRVGAYGNSAGAHLVSMLGLVGKDKQMEGDGPYQDYSSHVQAVVPSATPADFTVWAKASLGNQGRLLFGNRSKLDERAKAASPVTYAHRDAPPFLIFHGTADRTVPLGQGQRLEKSLKNAGAKEVTLKIYEGAGHGVFRQHEKETLPMMEKFFRKHLEIQKPLENRKGNPTG